MAQETAIKVKIDDNEALQSLREMASLLERISQDAEGLKIPPGAIPSPPSAGPSAPSAGPRDTDEEKEKKAFRKTLRQESERTLTALTSQITMGSMTSQLGSTIAGLGAHLPKKLGIPLTVAGKMLGAVGRSLDMRQQRLSEIIGLEQSEAEISAMIDTTDGKAFSEARSKSLESLGLDPTATRQLMLGVSGAAGFRSVEGDLSASRLGALAVAERSGVSAGSLASLAGAITQNMGVSVGAALDDSLRLRELAEQTLDLRGPGVERFLGNFGGLLESFTSQGITASPSIIGQQLAGIAGATGQRGQRPTQIFQSLQGVARGAGSEISAPLQGLAQAAVLANIYSRSGSLLEAQQLSEALQEEPTQIIDIIGGTFGTGSAGQSILAALPGLGTQDASNLIGGVGRGVLPTAPTGRRAAMEARMRLSAAQAAQTGQTVRSLRDDPQDQAVFEKMIEVAGQSERNMLQMTENAQSLIKLSDAMLKLQGLATSSLNNLASIIDKIARLIP